MTAGVETATSSRASPRSRSKTVETTIAEKATVRVASAAGLSHTRGG